MEGAWEHGKLWCLVSLMWKVLWLWSLEMVLCLSALQNQGVSGYAGPARLCAENAPAEQWEVALPSIGTCVTTAGGDGTKPFHHSGIETPSDRLSIDKV